MPAINIKSKLSKESIQEISQAIVDIIETASNNDLDQSSIVSALNVFGRVVELGGHTNITGCNFVSDHSEDQCECDCDERED